MVKTFFHKYWFNIIGTIILCGISFAAGWWVNEKSGGQNEALLQAAYRQITNLSIFNQESPEKLSYAAVRGMLTEIHDPYAELIEPSAAANFANTYTGKTGVVGLYTKNKDNHAEITIVYPNGSAENAGIRVGDILVAIDGRIIDPAMNSSETGLLLRGVPGTTVSIKTLRGGKVLDYNLVRKEQEFVTSRMLPDSIGYISLIAYNQTASQQFKQALESLLQQKPTGLIWDLRNNEGGDMNAAQEILSYFIKDGLLFTAQMTNGRIVEFRAKGDPIAPDLPLVILTDKTTYSASETCAAVVSETGRGKTVGQTTYGKGVIQATIPLPGNSMLQMTVAKWFSPKGEWYQGRGVPPQIEVKDDPAAQGDEILQKAVDVLQRK